MDKQRFVQEYSGYNAGVEDFRRLQLPAFELPGAVVYLDYAGSAPFTKTQVEAHGQALISLQWANPHSHGPLGSAVLERVQQTRRRILQFLNVTSETHEVIFTAGATAAFRLVADCFAWNPEAVFAFTRLNHNSVVGMRELAHSRGSSVVCLDENYEILSENGPRTDSQSWSLLAVPAECNFSGIRPCLLTLNRIRQGEQQLLGVERKWSVLLDASKYCATSLLDLGHIAADFTVISFYKMFGWPTGLGALIIRRDAGHLLCNKVYYGGGAYDALIATELFFRPRQDLASRFEDGSIAFSLIDGINYGFDIFESKLGGLGAIGKHCSAITAMVASEMAAMKHPNGSNVFEIYGHHFEKSLAHSQGPTIAFSVLNEAGLYRGFSHIQRLASACGLQIRSGCFCNSGACQKFLKLSPNDIHSHLELGHVCGDDIDLINGKPTGCIRISFGYASTFSDAAAWLQFARRYLLNQDYKLDDDGVLGSSKLLTIKSLAVFPLKSCMGFHPKQWPLSASGGFLWDRQFALVDERRRLLSQIKIARLAEIQAEVCLKTNALTVRSRSCANPYICSLQDDRSDSINVIHVLICNRICEAVVYEDSKGWFTTAAGTACRLIRFLSNDSSSGDMLVISDSSLAALSRKGDVEWYTDAFRANIVLNGANPFSEEKWNGFKVEEDLHFKAIRHCFRCTMIGRAQFAELSRLRSKPEFGVIFRYVPSSVNRDSSRRLLQVDARISSC